MSADDWLTRWLPLIAQRRGELPVFEIGCGNGRDSSTLTAAGHPLVGIDLSASAIEQAQTALPSARFVCQDVRAPWPVERAGVVIASLSLHYFAWDETLALVGRIRDCLRPEGTLLCRLNSTLDHHHGASGHPAIAEHYCLVDGKSKRFFDALSVRSLFSNGWRTLACEELTIDRYAEPKLVWEVILEPGT